MAAWLVKMVIITRPIDQLIAAASDTMNRSMVSILLLLNWTISKLLCVVRSLKLEKSERYHKTKDQSPITELGSEELKFALLV
jgi:hypothetical protein